MHTPSPATALAALLLSITSAGVFAQQDASSLAQTPATAEAGSTLLDRYEAGDYRLVASRGPRQLLDTPDDRRLRMAVANSLAWTGRYDEARVHYERLFGTDQEVAARIGIGNMLRWRGMPDRAAEQLEAARRIARDGTGIAEAQAMLDRDLKTATTLRYAHTDDTDGQKRSDFSLGLRYWSEDRRMRIDVTGLTSQDERAGITDRYRELRTSVFLPQVALSPRIELAASRFNDTAVLGFVQLEPIRDVIAIRAGRVNWGRTAFTSLALRDGLMANTVGASVNVELPVARVRVRYDRYAISDGNTVDDGELQVTPHFQPLPGGLVWLVGGAFRKADRSDPRYWSPDSAYGIATLGLRRSWFWDDAEIVAGVQRGVRLTDAARNTWAYSLSGRRWIAKDWAVALDASSSETPRPGTYRYTSVVVSVQKLW